MGGLFEADIFRSSSGKTWRTVPPRGPKQIAQFIDVDRFGYIVKE